MDAIFLQRSSTTPVDSAGAAKHLGFPRNSSQMAVTAGGRESEWGTIGNVVRFPVHVELPHLLG